MKVDEGLTKVARKSHERGIKILNILFQHSIYRAPFNAQTGRSLETPQQRRMWREWRDKHFPARVKRRRRRKIARASRKQNR